MRGLTLCHSAGKLRLAQEEPITCVTAGLRRLGMAAACIPPSPLSFSLLMLEASSQIHFIKDRQIARFRLSVAQHE